MSDIKRALRYKKFAVIDCETSGCDPSQNSIVQVALAIFTIDGRTVKEIERKFRPSEGRMSDEAFKVHGISYESVKDKNTYKERGSGEVFRHTCDKLPLIGYDLDFCLKFLDFKYVDNPDRFNAMQMTMDKLGLKGRTSLKGACERFGIDTTKPFHDAINDITYTRELFMALLFERTQIELFKESLPPAIIVVPVALPDRPQLIQKPIDIPSVPLKEVVSRGHMPYRESGQLYIPFDSPIEYQYWKKSAIIETLIKEEKVIEKDKYGRERIKTEKTYNTKKAFPDIKFKSLSDIEMEVV